MVFPFSTSITKHVRSGMFNILLEGNNLCFIIGKTLLGLKRVKNMKTHTMKSVFVVLVGDLS